MRNPVPVPGAAHAAPSAHVGSRILVPSSPMLRTLLVISFVLCACEKETPKAGPTLAPTASASAAPAMDAAPAAAISAAPSTSPDYSRDNELGLWMLRAQLERLDGGRGGDGARSRARHGRCSRSRRCLQGGSAR